MSIAQLPIEILIHIFGYFESEVDCLAASLTCRTWQGLCKERIQKIALRTFSLKIENADAVPKKIFQACFINCIKVFKRDIITIHFSAELRALPVILEENNQKLLPFKRTHKRSPPDFFSQFYLPDYLVKDLKEGNELIIPYRSQLFILKANQKNSTNRKCSCVEPFEKAIKTFSYAANAKRFQIKAGYFWNEHVIKEEKN